MWPNLGANGQSISGNPLDPNYVTVFSARGYIPDVKCMCRQQNWPPEARRRVLRTRHGMQLPAERKEAVLLETALLAATQAGALIPRCDCEPLTEC